jgi:hypothetical protein
VKFTVELKKELPGVGETIEAVVGPCWAKRIPLLDRSIIQLIRR